MATAHDKALTAAEAWDKAAYHLAAKERAHLRAVGRDQGLTLTVLAAENGVDISEWHILDPDEYKGSYPHYDGPAVAEVRPVIEQQQKLLKNASDLAGERN
jgi:hypothetical protein